MSLAPRPRSTTGGLTKLSRIRRHPGMSRTSPQTFRDRVLHIPTMITTTGSRVRIQLGATTCYVTTIAACGWTRLRHAFT
jgi:hypothetical protein